MFCSMGGCTHEKTPKLMSQSELVETPSPELDVDSIEVLSSFSRSMLCSELVVEVDVPSGLCGGWEGDTSSDWIYSRTSLSREMAWVLRLARRLCFGAGSSDSGCLLVAFRFQLFAVLGFALLIVL
ncbi:hypothetical protein DPMN_135461 [Dreissena polymorpha]|uniref:Uncharacterized protein n=1 Tax=Dreissena polymorpha TaxID=45954 RepID=A0A9D4FY62_DREPO|nr:hypothetical protein DPMN_135461 [Dreissena polymorpha]